MRLAGDCVLESPVCSRELCRIPGLLAIGAWAIGCASRGPLGADATGDLRTRETPVTHTLVSSGVPAPSSRDPVRSVELELTSSGLRVGSDTIAGPLPDQQTTESLLRSAPSAERARFRSEVETLLRQKKVDLDVDVVVLANAELPYSLLSDVVQALPLLGPTSLEIRLAGSRVSSTPLELPPNGWKFTGPVDLSVDGLEESKALLGLFVTVDKEGASIEATKGLDSPLPSGAMIAVGGLLDTVRRDASGAIDIAQLAAHFKQLERQLSPSRRRWSLARSQSSLRGARDSGLLRSRVRRAHDAPEESRRDLSR